MEPEQGIEKLETPLWTELEDVYEPSEDSFLLLDALEADLFKIRSKKPGIILEVGCGSGVIVTALSKALGSSAACLAIDINPKACLATSNTSVINNTTVEVVQSDLCGCLRTGIDLLIFNPPYVVTPSSEINGTLSRAWAGGFKGREITDRLLRELPDLMAPQSLGYIVAIAENIPEEICKVLNDSGFLTKTVVQRKVPGENLSIIRFEKT